jgi:hypothetical protein
MKALALGSGLLCVASCLAVSSSPASAANLVVNGSFEEVNLQSGKWALYGAGEVNGWTPTQGSTIESVTT